MATGQWRLRSLRFLNDRAPALNHDYLSCQWTWVLFRLSFLHIFFTQALVLSRFFAVKDARVGEFIFPLAMGNFIGPLALGTLFARIGRRTMISASFIVAGLLLTLTGVCFRSVSLTATTLAIAWSARPLSVVADDGRRLGLNG